MIFFSPSRRTCKRLQTAELATLLGLLVLVESRVTRVKMVRGCSPHGAVLGFGVSRREKSIDSYFINAKPSTLNPKTPKHQNPKTLENPNLQATGPENMR